MRHDLYPVFLDLHELPVLVVGGGAVAERKIKTLVRAGARVTVVAKDFRPALLRMKGLQCVRRGFKPADLGAACLVFAATGGPALNARIAALALERGVWVNVAAPPEAGNLLVPASFRRGNLSVAVSTGGASAAVAKAVRQELERTLDAAWGVYLELLERRRRRILASVGDPARRRALLQSLGRPEWVARLRREGRAKVARAMDALIVLAAAGPKRSSKPRR